MDDFKIPKSAEQVIPQSENLFKSILFIGLLVLFMAIEQLGITAIDSSFFYLYKPVDLIVKWALTIGLAVLNCILLTGMAVMAHESIHRVLFKSQFWNDLWGGILSALAGLLPFYANRQFHLLHHRHTHQPGLDPEEPLHNHSFWYAFIMGGLIGIYQHYKIVFANLFSFSTGHWNKGYQGLKDVCFVGLAVAFYFSFLPRIGISFWYTVAPTLLLQPLAYSFRALCDHYAFAPTLPPVVQKSVHQAAGLEDEYPSFSGKKLQANSWVILTNPLLSWLWSNVNYHQVHHRYPYLSHRYLPQIFEATKNEQTDAVVKGYFCCLLRLRKMQYYSSHEEVESLLEVGSGNAI
ncbi:MAG TPA: fatty acid desaturase [Waterburya sp.]|jgi:fatty acid desaturase